MGGNAVRSSHAVGVPFAIDRRLQVHRRGPVEIIELDVVLARPDDLHRLAELPRQQRGLDDVVGLRLAAEASAEQRHVAGHVFLLDAERVGDRLLHRLRILGRCVGDDLAVPELRDGGRWFHRGVRDERRRVGGLERRAAPGELRLDVTDVALDLLRLRDGRDQLRTVRGGVVAGMRARGPLDLERLASLEGRPRAVGDHRRPAKSLEQVGWLRRLESHHLRHAGDAAGSGVVDRRDGLSHHRRTLDGGEYHPRHAGVDAEHALPRHEVVAIDGGKVLADVLELRGSLEAQRRGIGYRQCRCGRDEFPVRNTSSRGRVYHRVPFAPALRGRDVPARSGRLFEHRARRRAGDTHRVVEILHRARAVGVLGSVPRVAERLDDGDARPVGFEFVGHDHGQARAHARPHL